MINYDGCGNMTSRGNISYTWTQGRRLAAVNNGTSISYQYDSWGRLLGITGSLKDTVGVYNPLRYRGYYYDTETGMYYLRSRYYDPEIQRFISADEEVVLGLYPMELSYKNLYSYCDNNPVIKIDTEGRFGHLLLAAGIGAITGVAAQYVCDVVGNAIEGKSISEVFKPTTSLAGYTAAALSGALFATGINLQTAVVVNAGLGAYVYISDCESNNEIATKANLALSTIIGGISGFINMSSAE